MYCVIPQMLYGSETWTLYRHRIKLLRTVQQRHLRSILKIKWNDFITKDEVLARSNSTDIETILIWNRLRWLGHVTRMPSGRPVKSLLNSELAEGSRKVGRPFLVGLAEGGPTLNLPFSLSIYLSMYYVAFGPPEVKNLIINYWVGCVIT